MSHVYLANADGSNATRLTQGEEPAWSPEGSRIAFHRGHSGISVIDVAGRNETFLGSGQSPSWSPDGSRIAFSEHDALFVMNANGTERQIVDVDRSDETWPRGAHWPSWSSAGVIAFVRTGYEQVWEVHLVRPDGSGHRPVGDGAAPAWSSDGATIALELWDGIWTMNVDGADARHAVEGRFFFGPAWTPEGRLVFSADIRHSHNPGSIFRAGQRLFVSDSGRVRQLVPDVSAGPGLAPFEYSDSDPAWAR